MRAFSTCTLSVWALMAAVTAASPAAPKPRCAGRPRTTSGSPAYPVLTPLPTSSSIATTSASYGSGTCPSASTVTIEAGTCSSSAVVSVTVTAVTTLTETVVQTVRETVTETTTASECASSSSSVSSWSFASSSSSESSSLSSSASASSAASVSSSLSSASVPGIICTETSTTTAFETSSATTTVTPGPVMIITTLTETETILATTATTTTRSATANAPQPTVTSTATVVETASDKATTTTTRTVFVAPTITGPTPAGFTPIHSVYPGNYPQKKRQAGGSESCTSTTIELVTVTDQIAVTSTATAPTPTSTSTLTTTVIATATTTTTVTQEPSVITPDPTTITTTTTSLTTLAVTATATATATDPSLPTEYVSGVCAGDNIMSTFNSRPITYASSSTGPAISLTEGDASPAACCMACFGSLTCAGWAFNPAPSAFGSACMGFQSRRGGNECDGYLSVGRFQTSAPGLGLPRWSVGNSPCGQVTASPLEVSP
ncbi:hypothetical protein Micbo1qcDRAFT_180228 [Microdochium bolleyi]|uniref:Apple domain-containing protein n=1 Tax=Microdochium bolleyi TaxID=196109 RepID=A0A136IM14_9PEZI|nr:hypothetical protein Micbo1qcDRAFT_180228 [Microdochium bolleyi]